MNIIKKLFFLLLLLNLVPGNVFAAQIGVSFDRNPVSLDESFQIIFTANDTPDNDPDFGPLEQDFEILGQSQSSNSSWINGQSSKTIQWTVNVMAKHPGSLVVPMVKFGDDVSQPASILVTQATANKAVDTDDDLFLEVEATPQSPYVQSQVLYTVRLYRRVEIAQASLNEPELGDAVIEKLGDDSNYNTQINGVNYLVTERKYSIFPQKSGSLTIKPLMLTAEVVANTRPNFNGFFNSQMTKTKKISSKSVTLDVKPAPATFTGKHWLSAEQLVLKEEWSGDNQQMKVGEPLTRTLTLLAKGTTVGQLPEINIGKIDDRLKTYPDQPVLQEQKKPEGLIAFREEKIAIIPSKAGFYKLPAIEIPWFNSQSQKMEIAKIPETAITALDAAGTQQAPVTPVAPAEVQQPQKAEQSTPITTPPQQQNIWLWVSMFLASGWLATLAYFLIKRSAKKPVAEKSEQEIRLEDSVKSLKKACADNNAAAAKDALLAWGRQKYGAASLGAIAELSDARLRDEILNLNRILYSREPDQWQGKKLFQAFVENKAREKIAVTDDDKLEPLYRL
ncbi:oxygen tolerance protein BatD [Methylobacter tundripaludum]|uniref:Oxygen tolerance protein BatD n=1 Tax=Methylobacter tundripaludum TaxID=173365 RepID=A0A2S6HLB4_9GAMM|nr:BatD family protein [Methylobacter tundripaludum]PPK78290.1 oxygen tolerance protein BatD [Methylobacter tundripaludum]